MKQCGRTCVYVCNTEMLMTVKYSNVCHMNVVLGVSFH